MYPPLKGKDLTFIESHLDETAVLEGEILFEQGKVSGGLNYSGKIWETSVVDDTFHYHVSTKLSGNSISSISCNCVVFKRSGACAHVAASLLFIRQKISSAQEEIKPEMIPQAKGMTRNAKGLSTEQLLHQVRHEDLLSFLQEYSKKDRFFKWMLHARFIEFFSSEGREQLIESLFPAVTKADQKIAAIQVTQFIKVSKELVNQVKIFVGEKNYLEGYHLLYLLIKKSFYIKYYSKQSNQKFVDNHTSLLRYFVEIVRLVEAPEFKEEIYNQIIQILGSSYISADLPEEKQLWILLSVEDEYREEVKRITREYLNKPAREYISYYFLSAVELVLLKGEELLHILETKDQQESYRIIQHLLAEKDLPGRKDLLIQFIHYKYLNIALIRRILVFLDPQDIKLNLAERLVEYFNRTGDTFLVSWLKKNYIDWTEIKKMIEVQPILRREKKIKLAYLLAIGDYNVAADTLKANPEFDLIRSFDEQLLRASDRVLSDVYIAMADHFLKDHYGKQAKNFMDLVLSRLKQIGADRVHHNVKEFIRKEYHDRRSLKQVIGQGSFKA